LGADLAIDYQSRSFVEVVKEAVPEGVDVVYDTMGGEIQAESYKVLKAGGILISIVDTPDSAVASAHGVRSAFVFVSPNGGQLRGLASLVEEGRVKPPAIKELPLAEAAAAQEESRGHRLRGKIVLKID
jgi:NADPH2:quinone reductase